MKRCTTVLLALAVAASAHGQLAERLSFELQPVFVLPILSSETLHDYGAGTSLAASARLGAGFSAYVSGAYSVLANPADDDVGLLSGGGGLGFSVFPLDRIGLSAFADGGAYAASWGGRSGWSYYARGGASFDLRLAPAYTLRLGGSYVHFFAPAEPVLQGVELGIGLRLSLAGLSGTAVKAESLRLDPIFPVFYSYYDKNAFGSVSVRNGEDGSIRDVRVSFFIKQYMAEPKLCASLPVMSRGQSVDVPIYALLNEDVLRLIENTYVNADVIIDYSFLGARRQVRRSESVQVRHRNAMSWDDDRRAAAFVSAKDPAVLRYAKFAAGLIREADELFELDQNLKFAMGLFEGLSLYGLNYVIDPTTPYAELSESSVAVDFLQYPYQTLVYKGGDCDDLSIMFAAVLQSVGIDSAFITVPGHIYLALALSSDEAAARRAFAYPDDLVFEGGKAWLPLEITLLSGGFLRAWQYGAREWRENPDTRALLPVRDAWASYEPVSIPGEDTRIVLPDADGIVAAYEASLAAFVDRELEAHVGRLRADLASRPGDARLLNLLGIVYARYGEYADAKREFEKAARAGSVNALCNLGNLSFLAGDYKAASEYFRRSLAERPENAIALLGLARSRYELEDFGEAASLFARLAAVSPQLAASFAYVASDSPVGRASATAASPAANPWEE